MYNDSFVHDQTSVAMSSSESELNGAWMSAASQVWLRNFLGEIGFTPKKPGVTHTTNKDNDGNDLLAPDDLDRGQFGVTIREQWRSPQMTRGYQTSEDCRICEEKDSEPSLDQNRRPASRFFH